LGVLPLGEINLAVLVAPSVARLHDVAAVQAGAVIVRTHGMTKLVLRFFDSRL
jgi:hypothetical protein